MGHEEAVKTIAEERENKREDSRRFARRRCKQVDARGEAFYSLQSCDCPFAAGSWQRQRQQ